MSLYQPSFAYPHNQSIDPADADDMMFSWQLNGNNLLCGYNIQIYDLDKNELKWELVSTEEQTNIINKINSLSKYIDNQNSKLEALDDNEEEAKEMSLKSNFSDTLTNPRKNALAAYNKMLELSKGDKQSFNNCQAYLTEWQEINGFLKERIGEHADMNENDISRTATTIKQICEDWLDIDPAREPNGDRDISYVTKKEQTNSTLLTTIKSRLKDSETAYIQANAILEKDDKTGIISTKTLNYAKSVAYSIYCATSNEQWYLKDLYTAVNNIVDSVNFDKKRTEVEKYLKQYQDEINQETYALSFFTGGITKKDISIYSQKNADDTYLLVNVPENSTLAITDVGGSRFSV